LARALAVHPDLLLLDEPFASLDAATAAGLVEQIADIVEAQTMTTLLIAHDIDTAIRLADIVYVLSAGPGRLLASIRVPKPRRRLSVEGIAQIRTQIAAAL
jgi:NitT/TauT family transport system ATP-binding protein